MADTACQDRVLTPIHPGVAACGHPQSGYTAPTPAARFAAGAPTPRPGAEMLDAYIIDKIRRDREGRERDQREQLRIDMPRAPAGVGPSRDWGAPEREPEGVEHDDPTSERGVVIVDFTL